MDNHSTVQLEGDGLVLMKDLRPNVPLHPQHIRKLIKRKEFPAPVKLGRRTAFVRREILAWCRRQAEKRDAQNA